MPLWKPLELSWRLEEASLALKSVIFKVTLSMLQRTALNLEQFSFRTSFGKRFGTVRDDLGSLLGWFGEAKIVISLETSGKNQVLKR